MNPLGPQHVRELVRVVELTRSRELNCSECRDAAGELAERQLAVPQTVQEWLLLRLPRSPAALREAVARLDRTSLASGSAITRSLAARVLADADFTGADPDEDSMSAADPSSQPEDLL